MTEVDSGMSSGNKVVAGVGHPHQNWQLKNRRMPPQCQISPQLLNLYETQSVKFETPH